MITPALVRADVVDIRAPGATWPATVALDANVLFWLFYANFSLAHSAGARLPASYQTAHYPVFWNQLTRTPLRAFTTLVAAGEFIKAAEFTELEAVWITDPQQPQPDPHNPVARFDPRVCKFARYHYAHHLRRLRSAVERMTATLLQVVAVFDAFPTPQEEHAASMTEWPSSAADFPDANFVATAKHHGVTALLSDDMDLATFAGVTLYTANQRTITAARLAGKLR